MNDETERDLRESVAALQGERLAMEEFITTLCAKLIISGALPPESVLETLEITEDRLTEALLRAPQYRHPPDYIRAALQSPKNLQTQIFSMDNFRPKTEHGEGAAGTKQKA